MAKQSNLEKKAIEKRQENRVRSDYNLENQYSSEHKDALSDGDPLGKGNGHGGHTHYIPDAEKPSTMYDYSNFDTTSTNIGGSYDIKGRNGIGGRVFLENISLYNKDNQYGVDSVDESLNIQDGQVIIK